MFIYIFLQLLSHTVYPDVMFFTQVISELTLVYNPGYLLSPQPFPILTTPTWGTKIFNDILESQFTWVCLPPCAMDRGPPESPWQASTPEVLSLVTLF